MRPILLIHSLATAAALLTGCARAVVTTEVKPDRTWTRTLKFIAPAPDPNQMSFSPKLEEAFALPSGAPWITTRGREQDEVVFTARRTLRVGETLRQDVVVKGGEKTPKTVVIVNEATIRPAGPGKLEYRELLRWQGPRPKEVADVAPPLLQAIRKGLPPALATDANARDLAQTVMRRQARVLFGPPRPLIGQMLFHPELGLRRLERSLGGDVQAWLQAKAPAAMPASERQAAVGKLVATIVAETSPFTKAKTQAGAGPPGQQGSSSNTGLTSLLFSVSLPGRLISTNGERDEEGNEVTWALLSASVAAEDVVLTATCELPP